MNAELLYIGSYGAKMRGLAWTTRLEMHWCRGFGDRLKPMAIAPRMAPSFPFDSRLSGMATSDTPDSDTPGFPAIAFARTMVSVRA